MKTYAKMSMFLGLCAVNFCGAQQDSDVQYNVRKLSDRVIVLSEQSNMKNNIVALVSSKGLIIIDTSGSPQKASKARETIVKESGRSDIAYVINTNHHWDHISGNTVFNDAVIVAHERCGEELLRLSRASTGRSDEEQNENESIINRSAPPPGVINTRGVEVLPPTITFSDQMSLDLGDLTLKLYYFGRAHSGSDIFIMVPEEKVLLTGDLFLDQNWLPLFAGQSFLDVPQMIQVLAMVLDGKDEIKWVIPGHQDLWSREKLALWRDYIVDLWGWVEKAKSEGFVIEKVINGFPLDEKYLYLKELGHDEMEIQDFHERNIRAFWSQLFDSAALVIERTIRDRGIDAALNKYHELKSDPDKVHYFDERQFNMLGYQLLNSGQYQEAIEIFKLNVEAYPGSWNVFDSLAEAYMVGGNKESAVKYYKKSLELNPENTNGVEMLKRLEGGTQ